MNIENFAKLIKIEFEITPEERYMGMMEYVCMLRVRISIININDRFIEGDIVTVSFQGHHGSYQGAFRDTAERIKTGDFYDKKHQFTKHLTPPPRLVSTIIVQTEGIPDWAREIIVECFNGDYPMGFYYPLALQA
jgi:hypothetical protein